MPVAEGRGSNCNTGQDCDFQQAVDEPCLGQLTLKRDPTSRRHMVRRSVRGVTVRESPESADHRSRDLEMIGRVPVLCLST